MAKKKTDNNNGGKDQLLEKLVKELEKNHGKGSVMLMGKGNTDNHVASVPSGVLSLDVALGIGGLPRGRIVEIYGNESSGKTTLTLQAVSEVQKHGGVAAFVDAEHALDIEYAEHLGIDVDKLIVSQPDFGEQALEIVDSLVRSNMVDIVVLDSVAALVPKTEIDGAMGDTHVGLQARLMSQALRKLAGSVSKSKTIVVFINQVRMKIGVMYGNPETTTGGIALKFYSSVRIEVRRGSQIREGKEVKGNETKLKVVKNKVAPPFKESQVDMIYGEGIAKENDVFNLAVEEGLIQRKGAWFSYIDDNEEEVSLGQGKINSLEYLKEHPELLEYFEYEIRKKKDLFIPEDLEKKIKEIQKGKKTASKKEEESQDDSDEKNDPDSLNDAENSAAHLIKYRMRAEKELRRRLKEKGYNDNIIDELIMKLKKIGVIDDYKFAYLYMYDKVTLNKKGTIAVSNDLLKLGVEKYIVDETAQKVKNEVNMYEIAKETAKKYLSTKNDFLKLRKYLFRRGFDTEIIEYVIKDLGGEADDY